MMIIHGSIAITRARTGFFLPKEHWKNPVRGSNANKPFNEFKWTKRISRAEKLGDIITWEGKEVWNLLLCRLMSDTQFVGWDALWSGEVLKSLWYQMKEFCNSNKDKEEHLKNINNVVILSSSVQNNKKDPPSFGGKTSERGVILETGRTCGSRGMMSRIWEP